jgi:hypothetical protein
VTFDRFGRFNFQNKMHAALKVKTQVNLIPR